MIFSNDTITFLKTKSFDDPLYCTHNDDVILSYMVKDYCESLTNIHMSWSIHHKGFLYRIKDDHDRTKDIEYWKMLLHSVDSL